MLCITYNVQNKFLCNLIYHKCTVFKLLPYIRPHTCITNVQRYEITHAKLMFNDKIRSIWMHFDSLRCFSAGRHKHHDCTHKIGTQAYYRCVLWHSVLENNHLFYFNSHIATESQLPVSATTDRDSALYIGCRLIAVLHPTPNKHPTRGKTAI